MKAKHNLYYPIFINVTGKRCVVVGGGMVALRKVKTLLEHGALVTVISPKLCKGLRELVESQRIEVCVRQYNDGDLKDAYLCIAATNNNNTNSMVARDNNTTSRLINVVDNIELSNFIIPACLTRGYIQIAVSTSGKSPALARKIRTRLERLVEEDYAELLDIVEEVRKELKKNKFKVSPSSWQQSIDIDQMLNLIRDGDKEKARMMLLNKLTNCRIVDR